MTGQTLGELFDAVLAVKSREEAHEFMAAYFGDYSDGRVEVGWSREEPDDHLTIEHGFAAIGDEPPSFDPDESDYRLLATEWWRVITERQIQP